MFGKIRKLLSEKKILRMKLKIYPTNDAILIIISNKVCSDLPL